MLNQRPGRGLGENAVQLGFFDQNPARLGAFVAGDDPAALQHVDQATGSRVADADEEFDPDEDPLLDRAIEVVVQAQTASTSLLQRRLRVGYTRAGRLIDMLERRGIISGYEGSKPRQVLVTEGDLPRVLASLAERTGGDGGEDTLVAPGPAPAEPDGG